MTDQIVVVGAGAGGSRVANAVAGDLRREIARGEVAVTVLDRHATLTNQAGFTFVPFGLYGEDDLTRHHSQVLSPRVTVETGADGAVDLIDTDARTVSVESGASYDYDQLVVATGCRPRFDRVSGLTEDEAVSFYPSFDAARELGRRLESFEGGRIVVLTAGMPIPCPGAPGKFTVLAADHLRHVVGVGNETEIDFLWPTPNIGPPTYHENAMAALAEHDVSATTTFELDHVDEAEGAVVGADGETYDYDLLVTIPPHSVVPVIEDSGLTDDSGWVPVDRYTLQWLDDGEPSDSVYVLGDSANLSVPKTGIGTHFQSMVVAANVVGDRRGEPRRKYFGETGCPFVGSAYTPGTKGAGSIAIWTYENPPEAFEPTKLGWSLYRAYYYLYWDAGQKALF